jgi:putative peptidoglycan lipid II flippase
VLLLIPVLLQIHSIVERRVASVVSEQAVAALDYARFLSDTAVLLLAMPLGVAGLGAMAAMSEKRFRDVAHRSMRALLYAGVPLSVAAALHGEAIVRLIFARGAFGTEAVATTTAILHWLGVGLWAQLIGYAGARFLSARDRNVALIRIYAASVGCNVALNLLLHPYLGTATLGVAAAANGLVFGLLVLQRLGLLARLQRDLVTLGALAGAYACLWAFAPRAASAHAWLPPLAFAAFWCGAVVLVPRCRCVLRDTLLSLRAA